MIRMVRAAGFAVAAFVLVVGAAWSGPSQATQAAFSSASFLDHGSAAIEISDIGFNGPEVDETSSLSRISAPVEQASVHAEQLLALADAAMFRSRTLGELVDVYAGASTDGREQDCLANAVYFEARGESIEGQLAVAEVVLNRAGSGRYPGTICEVVTQPWQFSFVRRGVIPNANRGSDAWRRAVAVARIAQSGASRLLPRDVLWYHAEYVSPSWGRRLARNTKIGLHIFYS